ncbi:membrane protein [Sediminihabitans luteus]|uniref:trimeric intracellular cation channel family protein n=1 Tax=Sediminihabitans luteus TaxID=1138585 RepID=UPI001A5ECC43|nr:trimeric intracellular cation channel family protein [Sediminihabitans luteus]GII98002.1 membrane protein [Sediminihabitans luteus]
MTALLVLDAPDVARLPFDTALEIVAVFCAALSGGLAAVRKNFDLFGVLVLAWCTGLGGGLVRDVLIGAVPPVGIADWRLVASALAAGILIFFLNPRLERMRRSIIVLDAGALALFVLVGTVKALGLGVGLLPSVIVGMLTGIGGGVLRDLLTGEVPLILQDRQLYAIPALAGALVTAAVWQAGLLGVVAQLAIIALVFGFRLASLRLGWTAPGPWSSRGGSSGRM